MSKKEKKNKTKSKKKLLVIIVLFFIALIIIGGVTLLVSKNNNGDSENNIATQSVKIFSENVNLFQNRYSGMVVAEDTVKIKKDSSQKVKELFVEKGQAVTKGQKLFEYDTSENSNKVDQAKLEIEKMQNSISNSQKQIQNLLEESKIRPDDPSISIEIQTLENDIKQTEYNIKTKNLEITNLNKTIKNAVVTAEIDGIIQNINDGENDTSAGYQEGENDSYITIMKTGDYRIKGVVNEQNIMMFTEGQKVIIRSRIDENKTWSGTISKVDMSNPEQNNNQMIMYGGMSSDEMTTSSKYPFYITLDSKDGLMMGAHVYIEFDYGQMAKQDGIWIPSYFVVEENGESYVWIAGKGDKLEKRKVTVGSKDENLLETQITDGLSKDDYIADPSQELSEGLKVNKYDNPGDIPMDTDIPEDMMNVDMEMNGDGTIPEGSMPSEGTSEGITYDGSGTVNVDGATDAGGVMPLTETPVVTGGQ